MDETQQLLREIRDLQRQLLEQTQAFHQKTLEATEAVNREYLRQLANYNQELANYKKTARVAWGLIVVLVVGLALFLKGR
jgi:hypothetical protein